MTFGYNLCGTAKQRIFAESICHGPMSDADPFPAVTSMPAAHTFCILKIDKDYRNYERVIGDMQAREETMAVTFVKQVRP